jgi:hypothetical protein
MPRSAVVIGLLLVLVIAVGAFYYYAGFSMHGQSTHDTTPTLIKSAYLEGSGILAIDVVNNGQNSTRTMQVISVCSPDFSDCQSEDTSPVVFVLPSGSEYVENLMVPQLGFPSNISPGWGEPIHGQSYFFKVEVTFDSGNLSDFDVSAEATGSFPLTNTGSAATPYATITVTSVNSSSVKLYSDQTGQMNFTLNFDHQPATVTAELLNQTSLYEGVFPVRNVLVSASEKTNYISTRPMFYNGETQIVLSSSFSTVTTGISKGTYYMVNIQISGYGNYFFWVQAL